jgi:hypothetical protein
VHRQSVESPQCTTRVVTDLNGHVAKPTEALNGEQARLHVNARFHRFDEIVADNAGPSAAHETPTADETSPPRARVRKQVPGGGAMQARA